jgi:hypothetical protein
MHYRLDEVSADSVLANRFSTELLGLLGQEHDRDAWRRTADGVLGQELADVVFPANQISAPTVPLAQRHPWRARLAPLREALTATPRPALELRMAVARLHLDLLAAGVWGTDESWRSELRDVVKALVPTEDELGHTPGQAQTYVSSLIAVCLALLLQDANLLGGNAHDAIAKDAWDSAGELPAYADVSLAEGYLCVPEQAYARVATAGEVSDVVDLAMTAADDPHAELRAAFELDGLDVREMDGVWVCDGDFRNPRRVAARIATLAGPRCVVFARNAHKASLVLLKDSTLAIAESAVPRWRIYQITRLSSPLSLLGDGEGLPTTRQAYPLLPVPDQITQLAEATGVNIQPLVAAFVAVDRLLG